MKTDTIALVVLLACIAMVAFILTWDSWNMIALGRKNEACMDGFIVILLWAIFSGLMTFLRKK
jgi:hypothetical protein